MLARNLAGEALVDEVIEIVAVADRDVQAARQGQAEARVIAFLRCRHAAAPRDAVLVLGKARRRQRDRGDGQGRRNESQAHRGFSLSGVSIRLQRNRTTCWYSARHSIPTRAGRASIRRKYRQSGGLGSPAQNPSPAQDLHQSKIFTSPESWRCASAPAWACRLRASPACRPARRSVGAAPY